VLGSGEPIRDITAQSPLDVHIEGDTAHLTLQDQSGIIVRLVEKVEGFINFKGSSKTAYRWRKVRPDVSGSFVDSEDLVEGFKASDTPPTWPAFCLDPTIINFADPATGDVVRIYPGLRDDRDDTAVNYGLEWYFYPRRATSDPTCECDGVFTVCNPTGFIKKKLIARFHGASNSAVACIERQFSINWALATGGIHTWTGGGKVGASTNCGEVHGSAGAGAVEFKCDGTNFKLTSAREVHSHTDPARYLTFGATNATITPTFFPFLYTTTYNVTRVDDSASFGTIQFTISEEIGTGSGGFAAGQLVAGDTNGGGGLSSMSGTRTRSVDTGEQFAEFKIGSDRWIGFESGSH